MATLRTSISRSAFRMRTAISPRFATSTLRMTRREAVPRSGDTSGAAERRFPSSRLVGDAAGRLAGAGPAGWAAAPRLRTDRGVAAGFARPGLERDVAMLLLRERLAV